VLAVVGAVPVVAPFPYIPDRLVEPVFVRLEVSPRGSCEIAVFEEVGIGEGSLPDVAVPLPSGQELVAPRVAGPLEAAAAGVLPLRLGRQAPPSPLAVGAGIVPTDVHHRVVADADESRIAPPWMPPARSGHRQPPRRLSGSAEYVVGGAGEGQMEHGREPKRLRLGPVAGVFDEGLEGVVRDGVDVNGELVQLDLVQRALPVGCQSVAGMIAHHETAGRDAGLGNGVAGR